MREIVSLATCRVIRAVYRHNPLTRLCWRDLVKVNASREGKAMNIELEITRHLVYVDTGRTQFFLQWQEEFSSPWRFDRRVKSTNGRAWRETQASWRGVVLQISRELRAHTPEQSS
jgi:hypothetical protein